MAETIQLKDLRVVADPIYPCTDSIRRAGTPIVIDNGSYQCRVGWATDEKPKMVFKNLMARLRREKGKKDVEILVGNDIANIEAVRFQLKTQFEKNVITHFEAQEHVFDYIFTHMGIDTEGSVNHPVVLTEAFLNPNYSRHLVSELLFECYHVPSMALGVDGLFSLGHNCPAGSSALLVNCGHHTTHILPVLEGRVDSSRARRISIGGFHITSFMHRLLQLKYPVHAPAVTLSRAEELARGHTYVAEDYQADLRRWADFDYYDAHVRRVQLPYTPAPVVALTPEQQKERRKELAKRLVEMNARRREERLAEDEERLQCLINLKETWDEGEEEEMEAALRELEVESVGDLQRHISQLQSKVERIKLKMAAPASQDEGVKEVKGRIGPKEKENLESWLEGIRQKREGILKKKAARRQRRTDMAKRRTVAAQERMRIISQLARKEKKDDTFGMKDEDWDVYKAISKEGGDTDSEAEQEELNELEAALRCHDPQFQNLGNTAATTAESYQLHVGVERVRVPELLFQPSMLGLDQAGIAETVDYVLRQYPPDVQMELVGNIFLTGGSASYPGLQERVTKELLEMRPFQSKFMVTRANNPALDAWNGAKEWAALEDNMKSFVTRAEYDEKGGEYLKEHHASNQNSSWPAPLVVMSGDAWSGQEVTLEGEIVEVMDAEVVVS